MIRLHRLSTRAESFYLNPDLLVSIDTTPDTMIRLTTDAKVMVLEPPEDIVAAVLAWRTSILAGAMPASPRRRSEAGLTLVSATAATAPVDPTDEGPQ